jgi:cell division protein FtsI/penicillin-binding protein 2
MATEGPTIWHGSAQRTRLVRMGLVLCLAFIITRLIWIQGFQHEYYKKRSHDITQDTIDLAARRGTITDRLGRELAVDRPAIAVYVHPPRLQDVHRTAESLGEILGIPADSIERRIRQCSESFMYVDRQADATLKPRILEVVKKEPQAIGIQPAVRRVYPKGTLAADLLGFTGIDHNGLSGLEASFEERLHGKDGVAEGERDVTGWPIPHRTTTLTPPQDGASLRLTLDVRVQEACERELAEGVEAVGAEAGCVIVMDVRNGVVLAACDYPTYNPSDYLSVPEEVWTPRFSFWTYEPGSTMKPLVAAMALAEGYVTASQSFYCGGSMPVGVWEVGCHQPSGGHGWQDLAGVLKYSCNVGVAQVGLAAGRDALTRLFERLHFTKLATREITAQCHPLPETRDSAWCATASFGQGVSITPLHLVSAYAALANGGTLMRPRFVAAAVDAQGRTKEFPPTVLGQIYPKHVADQIVSMLTHVVEDEDGTGYRAKVPGCTVAGKTGTAQVVANGVYLPDTYVVSFAGIFPAEAPRYAAVVVLDKAGADAYGGTLAAPIFRDIAQSLITDLNLPVEKPDKPIEEATSAE